MIMKVDSIVCKKLCFYYDDFEALKDINMTVVHKRITALIGPSGCGKSTLLRVFNRMNDLIPGIRTTGGVEIFGESIFRQNTDLMALRKKVGMVFQRPNPFPLSIFDNVTHGPKVHGVRKKSELEEIAENNLASVDLWSILKDRLNHNALSLSLEQQQRLCIARTTAVKPDILLMDEPCSALDPQATARIEELIQDMKENYTILIVTHNMQQAARVSQDCGFMLLGELVEFGSTGEIFMNPKDKRTEDYITGRYG